MLSNDELIKAADEVLWWESMSLDDNRSALLAPAVTLAHHVKSTLAADQGGEQIGGHLLTEEDLLSIGIKRCAERLFLFRPGMPSLSFDKIEFGYAVYCSGSLMTHVQFMSQLLRLLTALAIDTTTK